MRSALHSKSAAVDDAIAAGSREEEPEFMKPAKVRCPLIASSDSELRRRRSLKGQHSTVSGMAKCQLPRVQHMPSIAAAMPIERIPDNRTAQVLEMNADLVRPASAGTAFHEAHAACGIEHLVLCHGLPSAAGWTDRHFFSIYTMTRNWRVDHPAAPRRSARDKSKIDLANLPPGKLGGQRVMGRISLRNHKTTACFPVQTVNDAGTLYAADIRQTSKVMEQSRDERTLFASRTRVNNHPGRFVDDSEKIIFEENFKRHLLSAHRLAACRRRFTPHELIANSHNLRCLGGRAIEKHPAGTNHGLDSRARKSREKFCQASIKPCTRNRG